MHSHIEKQEWKHKGNNFLVEVARWTDTSDRAAKNLLLEELKDIIPDNHWNVYAYIFPKHPLFEKIINDNLYNYGLDLPLHWGASYHSWDYDSKGKVVFKKIGSDYQHLNDERFGKYVTADDAWEIFKDADELIEFINSDSANLEEIERSTASEAYNAN